MPHAALDAMLRPLPDLPCQACHPAHKPALTSLSCAPLPQPGDYHLSELMALRWPTGESPMMVKDAVMMVGQHVDVITLDIKTYDSPEGEEGGGGAGGQAL